MCTLQKNIMLTMKKDYVITIRQMRLIFLASPLILLILFDIIICVITTIVCVCVPNECVCCVICLLSHILSMFHVAALMRMLCCYYICSAHKRAFNNFTLLISV